MEKKATKLERALGGIKEYGTPADVVYVVDPRKESIAVKEARKMHISHSGHRGFELRSH